MLVGVSTLKIRAFVRIAGDTQTAVQNNGVCAVKNLPFVYQVCAKGLPEAWQLNRIRYCIT